MNNFYCTKKFEELQVHVQSRELYNCCKAFPERIDLEWLRNNPGKLFHTPTMVEDRKKMIKGEITEACNYGCYKYEKKGFTSRRMQDPQDRHYDDPYAPLIKLTISLSNDCNLTCTYCSPHWSSAWANDLEKGMYDSLRPFEKENNNWTKLWKKIKQKNRSQESSFFKLLINEIHLSEKVDTINLLGGETLLNGQIENLICSLPNKKFNITSGLGVSQNRLRYLLSKFDPKRVKFWISAEATGEHFEFIRFGSRWDDFLGKIEILESFGFDVKFISTISNLCIFSIVDFHDLLSKKHKISFNQLIDRPFLSPNVLDDKSKNIFLDKIKHLTEDLFFSKIVNDIMIPCEDIQKKQCKSFLTEFAKRRNLSLEIFPQHFLKWLDLI